MGVGAALPEPFPAPPVVVEVVDAQGEGVLGLVAVGTCGDLVGGPSERVAARALAVPGDRVAGAEPLLSCPHAPVALAKEVAVGSCCENVACPGRLGEALAVGGCGEKVANPARLGDALLH